ncbi:P97 family adhesin [Mycoplasma sp. 'Moose RK']|uniref:P97 family adhesin n=1 Tax=Mycoplasma sp. 'Moose RK' TaxID=2780095 RepID=UPI0018C1E260|nr:hypothetical protein [Mycoplasma sp. 'Moose RK']MBG0731097.1 hypothetical protein [Mycoplasma sp. 'Moose RK']
MKNKKSLLIGGTIATVVGAAIFGSVVGVNLQARYRGSNPVQGVVSHLQQIDGVAFKPSVAHFTDDYQTVKKALLNGKTYSVGSPDFANFANKFDFLTNNGHTVFHLPTNYQLVIQKFEADDETQRFRLSFYIKEVLKDGQVAQSPSKFVYLSPIDAPRSALAQYSDIVETNFKNGLVPNSLSHFSATSVKPLGLTRASDFVEKVNSFGETQQFVDYLKKFFDIDKLKANIRLQATGFSFAKDDLEEPFQFSFVKNPTNANEFATLFKEENFVRVYLKAEFNEQAKFTLPTKYKNKDNFTIIALDLKPKTADAKSLFADLSDLTNEIDVNLLDAADYYTSSTNLDGAEIKPLVPSLLSLIQRDAFNQGKSSFPKFSLYSYDAFNFYKQLQELVGNQYAVKQVVDATLTRGLTFSFGKYDQLFKDLRNHLDYEFLVSEAKIKQNSFSKKLFVQLPIKITLRSTVLGDSYKESKPLFEKIVSFKLDNFRDINIDQALETLYPEIKQDLEDAKKQRQEALKVEASGPTTNLSSQDGNSEISQESLIQWEKAAKDQVAIGSSKLNPFTSSSGIKHALSAEVVKNLIKDKKYDQLAELISDPTTYNVDFKVKSRLFEKKSSAPTMAQVDSAKFEVDTNDPVVYGHIFSASTTLFPNKASLFAYFRYLLSLSPRDAVFQLVKLAQKMGLQLENIENLPQNPSLADLKNVIIKTPFDGKRTVEDYIADDSKNPDFAYKMKIFDINNYYVSTENSPKFGLPLFLPANIKTTTETTQQNTSTELWYQPILKKLEVDKINNSLKAGDYLEKLPYELWKTLVRNNAIDNKDKVATEIFNDYQKALTVVKRPLFWQYWGSEFENQTSSKELNFYSSPFTKDKFKPLETLQDLVLAFYSQAAITDNWSEYQDSGAKVSVIFEDVQDDDPNDNVIPLKFHYAIGFNDSTGKFVVDVVKSSSRTIYLQTSGRSKAAVEAIDSLNQVIQDTPLNLRSFTITKEKFGHLSILANNLAAKFRPKQDEKENNLVDEDEQNWRNDKPPVETLSSPNTNKLNVSLEAENNTTNVTAIPVKVSTFSDIDPSPYFSVTLFQDKENKEAGKPTKSPEQQKLEGQIKEKLSSLLGQDLVKYFDQFDPNVKIEVYNFETTEDGRLKITLKLSKTITENGKSQEVISDYYATIFVRSQLAPVPELAQHVQVSDTKWAKTYDPNNPYAATTTITLKFKENIPQKDKDGKLPSDWLTSVPITIAPRLFRLVAQKAGNDEKSPSDSNDSNKTTLFVTKPGELPINLSLNTALNSSKEVTIENLKQVDEKTLTFDLKTINLKRLINAPMAVSLDAPIVSTSLSPYRSAVLATFNSFIDSDAVNNLSLVSKKDEKNNKEIFELKPKIIVEGAIQAPWKSLIPNTDLEFKIPKQLNKITTNGDILYIGKDPTKQPPKKPEPIESQTALSIKIYDPNSELSYLATGDSDEINLAQFDFFKPDSSEQTPNLLGIEKEKRGWITVNPNQQELKFKESFNLTLNRPAKVTYYSASDFILGLHSKLSPTEKNGTKTVYRKLKTNAASWGTSYLNLWYGDEKIKLLPQTIQLDLENLEFFYKNEVAANFKLLRPHMRNWWSNLNGSTINKVEGWVIKGYKSAAKPDTTTTTTTHNQSLVDHETRQLLNSGSSSNKTTIYIVIGGLRMQLLKSTFKPESRKFVVTTNPPSPLHTYDFDYKDYWMAFENEHGQLALLKAEAEDPESDTKESKGWYVFETTIPKHFFKTNIRFIGLTKYQADKNVYEWVPIINTGELPDYRNKGNTNYGQLGNWKDFKLTNNAFQNVFKEINIKKLDELS